MAEPLDDVEFSGFTIGETSGSKTNEEVESSSEITIGIDFGTSLHSIAVWDGSQFEILEDYNNNKLIGSYVIFRVLNASQGVSNGFSYERELLTGSTVFNMKRFVGRLDTDPVVQERKSLPFLVRTLDIGVRPFFAALMQKAWISFSPEEVLTMILMNIRSMSEIHLKQPVRDVVLTVPVSFSRFHLARVRQACTMAGLGILRLMPEPTAVALLYAKQQQEFAPLNILDRREKNALIFNMGAGFCDVAVIATVRWVSMTKAMAGAAIGGEDILQNMMEHLLPDSEALFSRHGADEIRMMGLLRIATQNAIVQLSSEHSSHVDVDLGNGTNIRQTITREEFDGVNHPVFEKCENLIIQCLEESGVEPNDLSDVILVGGCSKIPRIINLVKELCGKGELYQGIDPMEAAVRGAALAAARGSGLNQYSTPVTPLAIGIRADGNGFVPVILKITTTPTRQHLSFTTSHDNQTEALIVVYEGEGENVEENELLGYFKYSGIPLGLKGVPLITVTMEIDTYDRLIVYADAMIPGDEEPVASGPCVSAWMPNVEERHGWCLESLIEAYDATLDLATLPHDEE